MNIEKIVLIFVCSKWAGLSVSVKSSIFLSLKRRPAVPGWKKTIHGILDGIEFLIVSNYQNIQNMESVSPPLTLKLACFLVS